MTAKVTTKLKKIIPFIFLFTGICFSAFSQLSEDFSDGDFTANPSWNGETLLWQVNSGQLQSNSTVASSTFYLSTPVTTGSGSEWRIFINLKFATSGANFADIYLASDSSSLKANGSGYFVRVGGTTDEISLYRKDAGTVTKIIDGTDNRSQVNSTDNQIHLRITRSATDNWVLTDDNTGTGLNFFTEGSITDATYASGDYFGIAVTQSTATFFNKHFFDDIYAGPLQMDTTPPSILSVTALNANQADVLFSEAVELISSQATSGYSVNNGIGNPSAAILDGSNPALVHLSFTNLFTSGLSNSLTVTGVQDLSGNATSAATGSFTYIAPVIALPDDIIINEILADPSPQVGLPDAEFIELMNRSTKTFDLSGWTISDGSTTGILPAFVLSPGQLLILCQAADTAQFSGFGQVAGIPSFPSLNNTGDQLQLTDQGLALIDEVIYTDNWYRDDVKKDGGWSLELINPSVPGICLDSINWMGAINSNGGTPGQTNSIYSILPDTIGPDFIAAGAIDSLHVTVCFSDAILFNFLTDTNNYFIDQNIGEPVLAMADAGNTCVELTLSIPLTSGLTYILSQINLTDCYGNPVSNPSISFTYYEAEPADSGDLILNEVLFDPKPYGFDYIEIYNRSEKIIDLSTIVVAGAEVSTGIIYASTPFTFAPVLLLPGDYAVITENAADITARYSVSNPDRLFEVSDLPTFDDTEGRVVLLNQSMTRLDEFLYQDDFHFPLIDDLEGVSLERLSSDRPSSDPANWHSAAQTAGFGTPTYKNSQNTEAGSSGSAFTITPEIFSPDADGFHDVVTLLYHFDKPGYVANVTLYDGRGRLTRKLVRNQLLGNDGSFSWDGINENKEKAAIGIYVIYIEVFDQDGTVKKYKEICVLGGKL